MCRLLPIALIASAGAIAQTQPSAPSAVMTIDGKELYQTYCASCHGMNGRGGGPAAASLKTAPPDLTLISRRAGGEFPRERIERIISGEATSAAAHGSRAMPVWGPVFSEIEWDRNFVQVRLRNLADYLERMQQK